VPVCLVAVVGLAGWGGYVPELDNEAVQGFNR
jgi:hypothetical protein